MRAESRLSLGTIRSRACMLMPAALYTLVCKRGDSQRGRRAAHTVRTVRTQAVNSRPIAAVTSTSESPMPSPSIYSAQPNPAALYSLSSLIHLPSVVVCKALRALLPLFPRANSCTDRYPQSGVMCRVAQPRAGESGPTCTHSSRTRMREKSPSISHFRNSDRPFRAKRARVKHAVFSKVRSKRRRHDGTLSDLAREVRKD